MRLLECKRIQLEWEDAVELYEHPYPQQKRSKKTLHLSEILRHIAKNTNRLSPDDIEDDMPLRVFLGLAWEQMCVRLYEGVLWQPGEVEKDGVVGSPDGFSYIIGENAELVIEEFKYTAKSSREKGGDKDSQRDVTKDWLWMNQVMGYCNMMQTDLARLHVCYARGNYVWPMEEVYMRYLIRFEKWELEGNWKLISKYKHEVRYEKG